MGFALKVNNFRLAESTTVWFSDYLIEIGLKNIWGYDPVVDANEIEKLGVKHAPLEQGFKDATVVFLMNNHSSYLELTLRNC